MANDTGSAQSDGQAARGRGCGVRSTIIDSIGFVEDTGTAEHACAFCGGSLAGKRSDARYCGASCRAEAWRWRRLLAGLPAGRYATPADRIAAYRNRRHSRSQRPTGAVECR